MKQWQCTVCGYIHKGEEAPELCPVCGSDNSRFILVKDPSEDQAVSKSSEGINNDSQIEKLWRCTICGYIHKGNEPHDKCPVCGADKSRFVLVEENRTAKQVPVEYQQTTQRKSRQSIRASRTDPVSLSPLSRLANVNLTLSKFLTEFHGHPISVHIPNGVLPLAIFFTIIAIIFNSTNLAIAAKYNILFVCLFMPVVIFTGLVDWTNRFKARLTKIFKIKMTCAAIVMVLSLVLALWWFTQPEIYQNDSSWSGIFLLFHLIDFGAAAVAGWYGGKLVFPKR